MTYADLKKHLERTGRLKLLPKILRELRTREARAKAVTPRRETAAENPSLISGWREVKDGVLTDRTGKRALIDIYTNVTR
jgi:hypothetical protein